MKELDIAKRDLQNAEDTRQLTTRSVLEKDIKEVKEKIRKLPNRTDYFIKFPFLDFTLITSQFGFIEKDGEELKGRKHQIDQLEKEKKSWTDKVNQLEHLREKGKKANAALITKWGKALAAAKKKYEAKEKHFGNIDVEIKSREALIQDCQQVWF